MTNRMPTEEQKAAARRVGRMMALTSMKTESFRGRGFSAATIDALINAGIDAPERLLFMPPPALRAMKDIGPTRLKEINAYRAKYLDAGWASGATEDEDRPE